MANKKSYILFWFWVLIAFEIICDIHLGKVEVRNVVNYALALIVLITRLIPCIAELTWYLILRNYYNLLKKGYETLCDIYVNKECDEEELKYLFRQLKSNVNNFLDKYEHTRVRFTIRHHRKMQLMTEELYTILDKL